MKQDYTGTNTTEVKDETPDGLETNARRFMALFEGSAFAHVTYEPVDGPSRADGKVHVKYTTVHRAPTLQDWKDHLSGKRPLSIIPIREDGKCKFGSIDVDEYSINLGQLAADIERLKLKLLPVRSKSGGAHIYLFVEEWVPAALMRKVLKKMAKHLRLTKYEIFPKQD